MKETIVKINKTKRWFFEKINKIYKPLARIIKIKTEINEIGMKKIIAKINKTKRWFFEKINKNNKTLTRHIKEKKGRGLKSIKLEMKKEELQLTPQKYKGL